MSTFVIAEAGANHDQDYLQALSLVDLARDAGADAVKFQTYSSDTLYAKQTPNFANYRDINKLIKDLELPRDWQGDLKDYCDDNGIEFMSTPFDEAAVDQLYNLGVKRFKIAGFEATDPRIVKYVAQTKLPLIISAGIGVDIVGIGKILDWVLDVNPAPDITFLHCNNAYPTPLKDACLSQITKIKNAEFKTPIKVGLSDHTEGILVPPLAVALGADVIEKHFTISRKLMGPDHPFAIEPRELKQMVEDIRKAEICMGGVHFKTTNSEKDFTYARRSVVTSVSVKRGQQITLENSTTKRPMIPGAVPASEYFNISDNICYIFKRDIGPDEVLKWDDIEVSWTE